MLPLSLFRSRQFSGANVTTFFVYGALSGALFLTVLELQQVMGYSATEAGMAFTPMTLLLLVMSPAMGRLATRIGPRAPMSVGPAVAGVGIALLTRVGPGRSYLDGVFPGIVVFGIGLGITVAPLTAAVLAAVRSALAGVASAVNNAVARVAGVVAVAALPLAAGMPETGAEEPLAFTRAFHRSMWISAVVCFAGAAVAFLTVRREVAADVAVPPDPGHPPEPS